LGDVRCIRRNRNRAARAGRLDLAPSLAARLPDDIAVQRHAPYESRADGIMYRQVLSELANARGWEVHLYNAKEVVGQAVSMLAERADEVLQGPRATMGAPWTKDHRIALAATIVSSDEKRQRSK